MGLKTLATLVLGGIIGYLLMEAHDYLKKKPAPPVVEKPALPTIMPERERVIEKIIQQPPTPPQVQFPKIVITAPAKAKKLTSKKLTVPTDSDVSYNLLPDTDFAVITIFENPVYIEYGKHVDENSQLYPVGSTIVHYPPPVSIYFRASGGTANVYISEWKYVGGT